MRNDVRVSEFKSRLTRIIGHAHLVYLGLLPAIATFGLLYVYGHPAPLLMFLGGTAAVGVYLAVTFNYTPLPASFSWGLLVLLDGPAWTLLSLWTKKAVPIGFAVEAFIVDGTAIWLSIFILSFISPRPTRGQRLASAAFMLIALAAAASLVWPYFRDVLWGHWASLLLLAGGTLEAAFVRFKQLERDKLIANPDDNMGYLIFLILAWICAMIAGNVLHEFALKN
jgi:hypothetical protein